MTPRSAYPPDTEKPGPDRAIDSAVIQTFFASKSFGGIANIDPRWVTQTAAGKVSAPDTENYQQAHADWLGSSAAAPTRDSKARKHLPLGPTVQGEGFTRRNLAFPQMAADGRLRHTIDEGAANAYCGAGAARSSKIVDGRDLHTLVPAGHFLDGQPMPPLLRSFTAQLGGASKTVAGLTLLRLV